MIILSYLPCLLTGPAIVSMEIDTRSMVWSNQTRSWNVSCFVPVAIQNWMQKTGQHWCYITYVTHLSVSNMIKFVSFSIWQYLNWEKTECHVQGMIIARFLLPRIFCNFNNILWLFSYYVITGSLKLVLGGKELNLCLRSICT